MQKLVSGFIDVFANNPLSGNPLAVVENADGLDENMMKKIAREFNQSETTFLLESKKADYKLRSFTANGSEVYGAGHNALGAWLWLGYRGKLGNLSAPKTFHQEIGQDVLPITMEMRNGMVHGIMKQSPLHLLAPVEKISDLAEALGLKEKDILVYPKPRGAYTGVHHLMVRLADRATVDKAEPFAKDLLAVLAQAGVEGCYVYAYDENKPDVAYTRFFNPTVGLWEDPATGTAAGPLCAYLGEENLLSLKKELVVEQGTRMGRQSFLNLRLTPDVELSGSGVIVFQGELCL